MTKSDPSKYFHSSPEIIRFTVMPYVRFPLSLRNVEDLLPKRGVEISHESGRFYARAAAWIAGAERWTDEKWRDLEDQLGVARTSADLGLAHQPRAAILLRPDFAKEFGDGFFNYGV